jgi:hypothetical protein
MGNVFGVLQEKWLQGEGKQSQVRVKRGPTRVGGQ